MRRTFGELLADVHRYANALHALGVRRGDAVALMSPNCAELITATLAAQLAGIAAPLNGGLSRAHLAELLRRSGARVLVTAGPELAPDVWDTARELAPELDVILVLRPTGAETTPTPLPEIPGVRTEYLGHLAASKDPAAFAGSPPKRLRPGRPVPHRRHHRGAEAGRAHPRQRGRRRLDAGRELAVRRRLRRLRRAAAVPRERADRHTAGAALQGPAGRVGRAAGLPRTRAVRPVLADRRALPDRRDERRPHRLRDPCAGPGRRTTSAACALRWSARRRCPPRYGTPSRRTPGCACSRATA